MGKVGSYLYASIYPSHTFPLLSTTFLMNFARAVGRGKKAVMHLLLADSLQITGVF